MAAIASTLVLGLSGGSDPPRSKRTEPLTSVLTMIERHYRALGSLGAPVPDYQVGELWRRGIDGSGTTIAVIEA